MATTFTTTSSSPWSCLSEVSTTTLLPIHNSRVEHLKKRFSGIINKAQLTLGGKEQTLPNNNENNGNIKKKKKNNNNNVVRPAAAADCRNRNRKKVLKRERNGYYKTLIRGQEQNNNNKKCCGDANYVKKRSNNDDAAELETKKKMRKMEIQKLREAARKEIEEMRNDSGICDPQEVMRQFAKLIGYDTATGRTIRPENSSSMDHCC